MNFSGQLDPGVRLQLLQRWRTRHLVQHSSGLLLKHEKHSHQSGDEMIDDHGEVESSGFISLWS